MIMHRLTEITMKINESNSPHPIFFKIEQISYQVLQFIKQRHETKARDEGRFGGRIFGNFPRI